MDRTDHVGVDDVFWLMTYSVAHTMPSSMGRSCLNADGGSTYLKFSLSIRRFQATLIVLQIAMRPQTQISNDAGDTVM